MALIVRPISSGGASRNIPEEETMQQSYPLPTNSRLTVRPIEKPKKKTEPEESDLQSFGRQASNVLQQAAAMTLGAPNMIREGFPSIIPSREEVEQSSQRVAKGDSSLGDIIKSGPMMQILGGLPTYQGIREGIDKLTGYSSLQNEKPTDIGPAVAAVLPSTVVGGIQGIPGGLPGILGGAAMGTAHGAASLGAAKVAGDIAKEAFKGTKLEKDIETVAQLAAGYGAGRGVARAQKAVGFKPGARLEQIVEEGTERDLAAAKKTNEAKMDVLLEEHQKELDALSKKHLEQKQKLETKELPAKGKVRLEGSKAAQTIDESTVVEQEKLSTKAKGLTEEANAQFKSAEKSTKSLGGKILATGSALMKEIKNVEKYISSKVYDESRKYVQPKINSALSLFEETETEKGIKYGKASLGEAQILYRDLNQTIRELKRKDSTPVNVLSPLNDLRNSVGNFIRRNASKSDHKNVWGNDWLEANKKWKQKSQIEERIAELQGKYKDVHREVVGERAKFEKGKAKEVVKETQAQKAEKVSLERSQRMERLSADQKQEIDRAVREHQAKAKTSKRTLESSEELATKRKKLLGEMKETVTSNWHPALKYSLGYLLKLPMGFAHFMQQLVLPSSNSSFKLLKAKDPALFAEFMKASRDYDKGKVSALANILPAINLKMKEQELKK
jgi:hypothetical protein